MENTIAIEKPATTKRFGYDLETGQFAVITTGDYRGHVVVRVTSDCIVNLNRPGVVDVGNYEEIELLPVGTVLTLTIADRATIELTHFAKEEVLRLRETGQKLTAIKYVREITGAPLKESKEYVEKLQS